MPARRGINEYHLEFINKKSYSIFQDKRLLGINNTYFQIDNLLFTQRFSKEFGFPDPILQIKKQRTQLNYLMKKNDLKEISIITLIIISHPSTIITTAPDKQEVYEMFIHSVALPSKLDTGYKPIFF